MLLKGKSLQNCTIVAMSCHKIIFYISVLASSLCFHCYFGGPFDPILTVSTVV